MSTLIHQGKFRERANRTSRYQKSENYQTQLVDRHYQPKTDLDDGEEESLLENENKNINE